MKTPCKIRTKRKKVLADWKSRDLTQEDCADLAAYGNIPSTDNLPLVSGNQVVYMFIFSYLRMAAYRQIGRIRKMETLLLMANAIKNFYIFFEPFPKLLPMKDI